MAWTTFCMRLQSLRGRCLVVLLQHDTTLLNSKKYNRKGRETDSRAISNICSLQAHEMKHIEDCNPENPKHQILWGFAINIPTYLHESEILVVRDLGHGVIALVSILWFTVKVFSVLVTDRCSCKPQSFICLYPGKLYTNITSCVTGKSYRGTKC